MEEDKYIRYEGKTNNFSNPQYDAIYNRSLDDKEGFWKEQAEEVVWTKKPTQILDESDKYLQRWYVDGEMNICYNCVDRHVDDGKGDHQALQYDSAYTGVKQGYTYKEL